MRGDRIETGGAGIVWWWPAVTQFYFHPTARQSFDLRAQTITTKDNATVMVGGLISYQIDDITKAVGLTWDTDETIRDIALTVIHDVISSMTWEELRDPNNAKRLKFTLRDEARKVLEPYGVKVLKLSLTDFAKTRVLKVAMSNDTIQ